MIFQLFWVLFWVLVAVLATARVDAYPMQNDTLWNCTSGCTQGLATSLLRQQANQKTTAEDYGAAGTTMNAGTIGAIAGGAAVTLLFVGLLFFSGRRLVKVGHSSTARRREAFSSWI